MTSITSHSLTPLALSGIILDVDGTLVLSNDAHAQAWHDTLQAAGYDVPFERIRPLIGMGGDQLLPRILPGISADSEIGKKISARRKEIFLRTYVPNLRPTPGAHELVVALHNFGLHLIIGSSAAPDELEALLKIAQVGDLLPERTTTEDVEASKPAPDIASVALQRLGLPADRVALIGDAPYDGQSANKSNVSFIAVRCGGFTDSELGDAYAIYNDPTDLQAHLDEIIRHPNS
jgi:phosphoglycolate phosphatase-like HAD superfamily hydrolase